MVVVTGTSPINNLALIGANPRVQLGKMGNVLFS
jgi:hypothetical protein